MKAIVIIHNNRATLTKYDTAVKTDKEAGNKVTKLRNVRQERKQNKITESVRK